MNNLKIVDFRPEPLKKSRFLSLCKAAYCDNEEIANGAMDSFQELLESNPTNDEDILVQGTFSIFFPKSYFL